MLAEWICFEFKDYICCLKHFGKVKITIESSFNISCFHVILYMIMGRFFKVMFLSINQLALTPWSFSLAISPAIISSSETKELYIAYKLEQWMFKLFVGLSLIISQSSVTYTLIFEWQKKLNNVNFTGCKKKFNDPKSHCKNR